MLWSGIANGNEQIYPLAPTDTSSPRATLTSFLDNINEAFRRFQRGEQYASRREWQQGVSRSIDKTLQCLDLSQIAPALARDEGFESAVFLKEVLDRIDLPPDIEIPDADTAEANKLTKWTIPHTEITIAKLLNGPRQGDFLFTPQTIQRAREFYRRVKHLPYKKGSTKGLLQNYLYSPGYLIPWEWIAALPTWTKRSFLDQTVWQWISLSLLVLVGGILFRLISRWGRHWDNAQPEGRVWRRFGRLFAALAGLIISHAINLSLADQLGITGTVRRVVSFVMEIVIFISFAWLVVLLLERVAQAVIRAKSTQLSTLDRQVVRIGFRIISFAVVFYMLLKISEHFGMPLTPLLAGLGVGGVAVALAARSTLENIIGGFILFTDRPLKVGDFCRFGDKIGTVEEIGLRSTRVRSQERTIITVPNAEFANLQLENLAKRDVILLRTKLQLRYETTPDQLRFILAKLRELLLAHPKVTPQPARARFIGFGEHSLELEVFAYVKTTDWSEYLAICEDILLRMMDIIKQSGSGLAIPAQVHYVAQDEGVNAERSQVAEDEVERWRTQGKLPFPQFEPAECEQIENKLDYPPKGSPDAKN